MNVYTVRDKLIGYTGPMAFKDDKVAIRWFESFCKAKKEQEYTETKYFDLYRIGQFNNETGEIIPVTPTELVREGEQI